MKYIQIITSVNNKKVAYKIVKELLKEKIAGCCQIIGPVESYYWWEGKIENNNEWLIFIKTEKKKFEKVKEKIKEIHPYQIPEIISFEIFLSDKKYLNWLSSITKTN